MFKVSQINCKIINRFSHQSDYQPLLWHLSEVFLQPDNPATGDPDQAHQDPDPRHQAPLGGRTDGHQEGAEEEDRTGYPGDLR